MRTLYIIYTADIPHTDILLYADDAALITRGLTGILQKGVTVQEAIDIVFGENDDLDNPVEAIYIAPPEPAVLTNVDSGDEDEGGDLDHLSQRQLLAEAEVRFAGGVTLEDTHPEYTDSNGDGSSSKKDSTQLIWYTQRLLILGSGFRETSLTTNGHFLKQITQHLKTNQL
ncbi:unnamed protein product [Acanthoscelides obtectus]|uniref:Uncharacterized protein n=1 Tax=Acanthoscelides obtectus TaxID=200917 RepID=A0A9P0PSL6_ACAOB|nr:unnamed protein product [Acanthoscelides obtectus]CAK1679811.1 hypothetical protein AOBTE_LOCUS32437 [Acanthoscelides obtectus]